MSTFVERLAAGSAGKTVKDAADIRPALTPDLIPEALRLPVERRALSRPPPARPPRDSASRPDAPQGLAPIRSQREDSTAPTTTGSKVPKKAAEESVKPEPKAEPQPTELRSTSNREIDATKGRPATMPGPLADSVPEPSDEVDIEAPPAYSESVREQAAVPEPAKTTPHAPGVDTPAPEGLPVPERRARPESPVAVEPMDDYSPIPDQVEASEETLGVNAEEPARFEPTPPEDAEFSIPQGPERSRPSVPEEEDEIPTVEAEEVSTEPGMEGSEEVRSTRSARESGFGDVSQRSQDPVVTINIGRIEVRAVNPEKPPVDNRGPSLSLEEYMKRRGERGR